MRPPDDLLERVARLMGADVTAWQRATGGYSVAERWSLDLADGRRAFAKLAPTDDLAWKLRDELRNMSAFDGDFRCDVLAFEDGERPLLVLEDLREARWPPPWEPGDIDRVVATLQRLWDTPPPSYLPDAGRFREMFAGWDHVLAEPAPFLSLGLASSEWVERCVPALSESARSAPIDGRDFLHLDVRSDNMCFDEDRIVFVDWNWASTGPRDLDLACWLPALRLEGGPLPEEVAPGLGSYAAGIAAYFATYAPLPPPAGAPTVRRFQLRQLRIALPWACRELGLPQPDRRWAMDEIALADADLAEGRISEAEWYTRIEEPLIDAYLGSDDPRAGSGKGGDETEWRWARELILDAFPPEATFLDIGCANGYLMESVHTWGAERGIAVEPYGLDISWRIASLARRRLPQWADRIFVGNVVDWTPPRRFDVVQVGIDEVPVTRRRSLIERVLSEFVTVGGLVVFRADRAGPTDPALQLEALGLRPDGEIEAAHPLTGELRRTAYLRAPIP